MDQDPVRGTGFAEQALSALQKHATQGPWPKNSRNSPRASEHLAGKAELPDKCH
jgi:hypothetical protein